MANDVNIGIEEMRSLMLASVKALAVTQNQFNASTLRTVVAQVAISHELLPPKTSPGSAQLPDNLRDAFDEVLWSFQIEGLLFVSSDNARLRLTAHGQQCVEAGSFLPHDPAGYLADLSQVQALDTVEQRFVPQALEAFRRNIPDASAVMLGCASEHLVRVLAQALVASNPTGETKTQNLLSRGKAKTLLDHLNERLEALGKTHKIPWQLEEMRDTYYNAIGQLIRVARNDAGHPARQRPVDRDACFVLLELYRNYRRWVYEVIPYL